MATQVQQAVPVNAAPAQASLPEQGPAPARGAGNQARIEAVCTDPVGEPRGGVRHTVQRGDTLFTIAAATYGSGRYWPDIQRANPNSVFRGGQTILVGDVLALPVIHVDPSESESLPGGGETPALAPRDVCTDWANFRVFPDDYSGELPESDDGSLSVRESEFHVLMEQSERDLAAETEAATSDIGVLLAYGALDWAITEEEARAALRRLAALPIRGLQAAVGRIDVSRLLSNLPSDAVETPEFCKVAIALGPARIGPFLSDVLGNGLFDWAVTDADTNAVMSVLGALGPDQREQVLAVIDPQLQRRFLRSFPAGGSALTESDRAVLASLFASAGGDVDRLTLAFAVRFGLNVRGTEGTVWDEAGLRRCWAVLEALPDAHVEGNPELLQWIRYTKSDGTNGKGTGGWYDDVPTREDGSPNAGFRAGGINYDPAAMDNAQNSEFDMDADGIVGVGEQDPLHGVNRFNKVVRHEVGHAVDEQIGGSRRYCIGRSEGGAWAEYGGNAAACIADMVDASGAGIARSGIKDAIIAQLTQCAVSDDAASALTKVQSLPDYQALSPEEQGAIDADPAFVALSQATDEPWRKHLPDGGVPLGGRIFQRSYQADWSSYGLEARSRRVSQYQFRAPGEWFAEAYAAYYEPKSDGTCDHATLDRADSATKAWFDANVDSLGST